MPENLREEGICIIAVNYRLHPEVSSPGYIEDAAAAVAWVFNNIDEYGGDVTHSTIRKERGIDSPRPIIDDLAPAYHIRANSPPLLLITGDRELEMSGRYVENAYLMSMMKAAGHQETKLFELNGYGHSMVQPAVPLLINEVHRITESQTDDPG